MQRFKPLIAIILAAVVGMGMYVEREHEKTDVNSCFMGLGDLPGGLTYSVANGISADGGVVVGYSHSQEGIEAFRWTPTEGMQGLGFQNALATSGDGSVVVGQLLSGRCSQPACWTTADGAVELDVKHSCRGAEAHGVTADGAVLVGAAVADSSIRIGRDRACAWALRGEAVPLLDAEDEPADSDAFGVSADGRVIVGARSQATGNAEAFRWTAESGMTGLGFLPGHTTSAAYAVSADGSVIVGYSSNFTTTTAFRWTEETGMVALSNQSGEGGDSTAFAVSADGKFVVGSLTNRSGQDAVIWDGVHDVQRVRDLLPSEFAAVDGANRGWKLQMATAVSADRSVVAGVGRNALDHREAWVARLDHRPVAERGSIVSRGAVVSSTPSRN